jgi:hypothetical protein
VNEPYFEMETSLPTKLGKDNLRLDMGVTLEKNQVGLKIGIPFDQWKLSLRKGFLE